MCNFKGILIISLKMKNLLFLLVLLFGIQLTAQESHAQFSTPKDSLSFTHKNFELIKLPKFLENLEDNNKSYFSYFPIRKAFGNYNFKYTAEDVAYYLYVEQPLLKRLYPNYNYIGGHLADLNNNYTPDIINYKVK